MILWLIFAYIFNLHPYYVAGTRINDNQFQMVADGLKIDECRRLLESLYKDRFQQRYNTRYTLAGPNYPWDASCGHLLEQWSSGKDRHETFRQLYAGLLKLGRMDLANRLIRSVDVEMTLDKAFPFHLSGSPEPPHPTQTPQESNYIIHVLLIALIILVKVAVLAYLLCFRKAGCCKNKTSVK